ncbi:hypothetical protein DFP72DRAFT_525527 [Ephemerocybe angulata]|uniref:Uncharacterized protein n=1 Tax=Ephemerocybe angulata TaxID=980116 RepID=A0A8H6IG10_9AGAR|nr:hypothetical protein DFP72DRAFT_525527 [Tulosesus angulatus]
MLIQTKREGFYTDSEEDHLIFFMFPVPVGGVPLPSEFGACIVFAIAYGLLVPFVVYRVFDRRSRTVVILGIILQILNSTVQFSMRAAAIHRESLRASSGFLKYTQISFGMGFVTIANDLVNLLRCVQVNPTYGYGPGGRYDESPASQTKDVMLEPPSEGDADHPRARRVVRRFALLMTLTVLASNITGSIAASRYAEQIFTDQARADSVFDLRYASAGVALLAMILLASAASWSLLRQPRACRVAVYRLFAVCFALSIIAIYRLAVMHIETPSLDPSLPGTLNSPAGKALFYLLHVLPEWVAAAILIVPNTRKAFGTGIIGDYRGWDDSPAEIQKRRDKQERVETGSVIPLRDVVGQPA